MTQNPINDLLDLIITSWGMDNPCTVEACKMAEDDLSYACVRAYFDTVNFLVRQGF